MEKQENIDNKAISKIPEVENEGTYLKLSELLKEKNIEFKLYEVSLILRKYSMNQLKLVKKQLR